MRTPEASLQARSGVASPARVSPTAGSGAAVTVTPAARAAALLVALVLLGAGIVSAADGVARWLSRDGEALARLASQRGEMPPPERVTAAVAGTRAALAWQPWSPHIAAELGALELILAIRAGATDDGTAHAGEAASAYRRALRGRPSSGYFWSGLATAELLARSSPAAVEHALQRAMVLGGWDPAVRLRAMWLGMTAWPMLGPGARGELRTLVRRSLEGDETAVFDLAAGAGWTAELRALLTDAAQRSRLDRRIAAGRAGSGGS